MSIENVRIHMKKFNRENDILVHDVSTATVELAAIAHGVEGARIAKTMCLKNGEGAMLIVTSGDKKIDNKKFKEEFRFKAKMLTPEETLSWTGHEIGGVCPFGIEKEVPVYLDISMKRFSTIFPAAGTTNSSIEVNCDELEKYTNFKKWVDVCRD